MYVEYISPNSRGTLRMSVYCDQSFIVINVYYNFNYSIMISHE